MDGAVEYALYAPDDSLPPIEEIRALAGDALLDVRAEPVADGWDVRWHEHLRPVRVGDLLVRPPWIDGSPDDLVIDPGTFFGAGTHPTTRLCLELLQDCPPGGALCDWGAGTGVLAIAAARLGWSPVTAVELDAAALDLIGANAARNHVEVKARGGRRARARAVGADGGGEPPEAAPAGRRPHDRAAGRRGPADAACGRRSASSPPACSRARPARSWRPTSRSACASAGASRRTAGRRWCSRDPARGAGRTLARRAGAGRAARARSRRARGARRRRRHGRVRALRRGGRAAGHGRAAGGGGRGAGRRVDVPGGGRLELARLAPAARRRPACGCGRRGSRSALARSTS